MSEKVVTADFRIITSNTHLFNPISEEATNDTSLRTLSLLIFDAGQIYHWPAHWGQAHRRPLKKSKVQDHASLGVFTVLFRLNK